MDWDGASEFMTHLGNVYRAQGRYAEAEALYRDALVRNERFWGPAHNLTAETLNDLAVLYAAEGRIDEALPYSRKATAALVSSTLIKPPGPQQREPTAGLVAQHSDYFRNHVAILAAAVAKSIAPPDRLGQEAFEAAQWANQTAAAAALEKMGMRIAGGNDALASLVRESQDLAAYWRDRDNALIAARSKPKNQLDPAAIDALRRQLTDTEAKLAAIAARLEREFPDYAVLAQPRPLSLQDAQKLLEANEALMFWIVGDKESYCFAITRDDFQWRALPIGAQGLAAKVAGMRVGPDVDDLEGGAKNGTLRLFNLANAHELYGVLTGMLEKLLRDKTHVMVVASGALTSLPFHLLITEPPAVAQPNVNQLSAYKSASWLIKRQAITVLPSVASLRALRSAKKQTPAERPLVGYGDPTFRARVASATDGESAAARAAV